MMYLLLIFCFIMIRAITFDFIYADYIDNKLLMVIKNAIFIFITFFVPNAVFLFFIKGIRPYIIDVSLLWFLCSLLLSFLVYDIQMSIYHEESYVLKSFSCEVVWLIILLVTTIIRIA